MTRCRIAIPHDELAKFCRQWRIIEFAVFGSAVRDDFGDHSDVDVLVTFAPEARWGLFDLVRMKDGLREILGRDVDLVSRRGIEASRNYIRRRAILSSAEVVHVAR